MASKSAKVCNSEHIPEEDDDSNVHNIIEKFQETLLKMTDKVNSKIQQMDKHLADLEEITREALSRRGTAVQTHYLRK